MEQGARLLSELFGRPDWIFPIRELLRRTGSWLSLYRAGPEPWLEALGEEAGDQIEALNLLIAQWMEPEALAPEVGGPQALSALLRARLSVAEQESFWVVMLDGRSRFLGMEEIARGILNACLIHPREVFAPAIRARAGAVVVVHNHPSGDPSPSEEDLELTDRLVEVGQLIGIPLVDHLVMGWGGIRSILPEPPFEVA